MKTGTRLLAFAGGTLLVGAAAALGGWALRTREASIPSVPKATVPASWHVYREAPGHLVHVDQEGIACKECHDLDHGFAPLGVGRCAKCHQSQSRMQHALHPDPLAKPEVANCLACHGFGPEREDQVWDCMRCHEDPQGSLAAVRFHAGEDCGECHEPHAEPAVKPLDCVKCHASAANQHGAAGAMRGESGAGPAAGAQSDPRPQAGNCLQCHSAHDAAVQAADRCTGCHEQPHALFPGHDRCTDCHQAHGFTPAEAQGCRSCHASQHVLAQATVPAHRDCLGCHQPHDVVQAGDATCVDCHDGVSPTHPAVDGHTCTSCHAPHPQRAGAATASACTQCHALGRDDRAAHGGQAACTSCHQPHRFAKPSQAESCAECHGPQLAAIARNAGHAKCLGCHQGHPHDAELPARPCASCHAQVHPRKEHAPCTSCHEPHSGAPGKPVATCAHCHAAEQQSASKAHKKCLTCHTPHEGGKRPEADCTSCHRDESEENHGDLAQGCTACHGIHAPKGVLATPACSSCHAPASLPGLHALPAHRECAKCHDGAHDRGPFSERATCLACHAPKRNHVPEAQLCQGCHVFRQ